MKRIYLWLIPLSFVWPAVFQIDYYRRFQKFNSLDQTLQLLPFGVVAAVILLYAWDRSATQRQKWLSALGYLLASPIAYVGSLGGGLIGPVIGTILFGGIPLAIGTFFGYYLGKRFEPNAIE